jgi:hypothetical protein
VVTYGNLKPKLKKMSLLNLTTNLKSLKYGKDRPGGGDSRQPYIQKPIPSSEDNAVPNSPDFILRGGLQAPARAASDLLRLGKYFTDLRTPNGVLFTAKQNLLSRISVATEASINASYGNNAFKGELGWTKAALNQGIYTPTSTLLQSVNGFVGNHLNTFGLDPFTPNQNTVEGGLFPSLGLIRYEDAIKNTTGLTKRVKISSKKNKQTNNYRSSFEPNISSFTKTTEPQDSSEEITIPDYKNRLIYLYTVHTKPEKINETPFVLEYNGGPGAPLGIGKTKIKFAEYRTGQNNKKLSIDLFREGGDINSSTWLDRPTPTTLSVLGLSDFNNIDKNNFAFSLRNKSKSIPETTFEELQKENLLTEENTGYPDKLFQNKREGNLDSKDYLQYSTTPRTDKTIKIENVLGLSVFEKRKTSSLSYETLTGSLTGSSDTGYSGDGFIMQDGFIKGRTKKEEKPHEYTTLKDFRADDKVGIYNTESKILEGNDGSRINLRSPGRKLESDTKLKNNFTTNTPAVDKINAYPIYKSPDANSEDGNDLVKFRIGVINGEDKEYMHFRAFIDGFSDSYDGKWSSTNYMGRGESFYTYNGFDRSINLSFTVAAQSRAELIPQYQKLNFLASTLAPKYSDNGYMGGQLVSLTVGGWLYEQVGFISSLTLDVPQESPWEIGIDNKGNYSEDTEDKNYNKTVKELPHMVKVSGFKFTPIHNFRPEVMKNSYGGDGGIVSEYGGQRFIALKASSNSWDYRPPKP